MSLYQNILENIGTIGKVGGMIKLIVGPLGVSFSAWGFIDGQYFRTDRKYIEGELIPIVEVKSGIVYVVPFYTPVPFDVDSQDIKGISISKYKKN